MTWGADCEKNDIISGEKIIVYQTKRKKRPFTVVGWTGKTPDAIEEKDYTVSVELYELESKRLKNSIRDWKGKSDYEGELDFEGCPQTMNLCPGVKASNGDKIKKYDILDINEL